MTTYNLENEMDTELALWKKQFTTFAFSSVSFAFLLSYIVAIYIEENSTILGSNKYFYFFAFLIIIYIWYLITKTRLEFDPLVKPISIFIVGIIFYSCLIECHISILCYTYYIPIIIISLALNKVKHTLLLTLFFIIVSYFTKPLSFQLGLFSEPITITNDLYIYKIITSCISIFFITSTIFFYYKFKLIKKRIFVSQNDFSKKEDTPTVNFENEIDKFEILYSEILLLFENEKPYQNPEFNIKSLSEMLNSNHAYVSKTLNEKANKNFKKFANHYRINQVLDDFDKRNYKRHTIESIYTKAGFTQQSTFNRVFKELNGITPSEYIEEVERKNAV